MLKLTDIAEQRNLRYRRRSDLALRNVHAGRKFIDDVGFCFLFTVKGYELPTLWEAINGGPREIPKHHHDRALGLAWSWKDSLPGKGAVYYGKLIQGKPTLVSLRLLPHFYAHSLSQTYGDPDEWRAFYEDGKMSDDARRVYEVLLEMGPSPTSVLRREASLYGHEHATRFDRAIGELQRLMLIVMSGVSDANRWKYCFVYDTLDRRFPDMVKKALDMPSREAMQTIIGQYVDNVVLTDAKTTARLFGWDLARTDRVIDGMLSSNLLRQVEVEGMEGSWLVSARD